MRIRMDMPPGLAPGARAKLGVDAPSGGRYVFRSSLGMVCDIPEPDASRLLALPGFHALDPELPKYDLQYLDRAGLLAIAARMGVKFHHKTGEATMREKIAALLAEEATDADDAGIV